MLPSGRCGGWGCRQLLVVPSLHPALQYSPQPSRSLQKSRTWDLNHHSLAGRFAVGTQPTDTKGPEKSVLCEDRGSLGLLPMLRSLPPRTEPMQRMVMPEVGPQGNASRDTGCQVAPCCGHFSETAACKQQLHCVPAASCRTRPGQPPPSSPHPPGVALARPCEGGSLNALLQGLVMRGHEALG